MAEHRPEPEDLVLVNRFEPYDWKAKLGDPNQPVVLPVVGGYGLTLTQVDVFASGWTTLN